MCDRKIEGKFLRNKRSNGVGIGEKGTGENEGWIN